MKWMRCERQQKATLTFVRACLRRMPRPSSPCTRRCICKLIFLPALSVTRTTPSSATSISRRSTRKSPAAKRFVESCIVLSCKSLGSTAGVSANVLATDAAWHHGSRRVNNNKKLKHKANQMKERWGGNDGVGLDGCNPRNTKELDSHILLYFDCCKFAEARRGRLSQN